MRLYFCRLAGTKTATGCCNCWDRNDYMTRKGPGAMGTRKLCQLKYAPKIIEATPDVIEGILAGHK